MPFDISRENQPSIPYDHYDDNDDDDAWWILRSWVRQCPNSRNILHQENVCCVLNNLYSASLSLNYCQNIIQNLRERKLSTVENVHQLKSILSWLWEIF